MATSIRSISQKGTGILVSLRFLMAIIMVPALVMGATPGLVQASQSGASATYARRQAENVRMANIVAKALKFKPNGKEGRVTLDKGQLAGLDKTQVGLVKKLVTDINNKSIGIAVVAQDGSIQLYGNPRALEGMPSGKPREKPKANTSHYLTSSGTVTAMNAVWADGWGLHMYIDWWWTEQLTWLNGWAVSAIAGLLVTKLCSTGVGCLGSAVVVAWVWDQVVWNHLRKHYPHSFNIHAPWWGWVHLQPFRNGYWYHSRWFQTWLWT